MITKSALITRASAAVLASGGIALLFSSDSILPALAPGFPGHASWLGQIVGAGWLAVAALNWLSRSTLIGGIYGRPVVLTNLILYFIGSMVLLRALREGPARQLAAPQRAALWRSLLAGPVLGWLRGGEEGRAEQFAQALVEELAAEPDQMAR